MNAECPEAIEGHDLVVSDFKCALLGVMPTGWNDEEPPFPIWHPSQAWYHILLLGRDLSSVLRARAVVLPGGGVGGGLGL